MWSYEETLQLIQLWSSDVVQKGLRCLKRNKTVWESVAQDMRKTGFQRTNKQCKSRMNNIFYRYKQVKKNNRRSVGARMTCPFFEEIDSVLTNKGNLDIGVIDSSVLISNQSSSSESVYEGKELFCETEMQNQQTNREIQKRDLWAYRETKQLIDLWSSDVVQSDLQSMRRNKTVWEGIAREMMNAGFQRTHTQCKARIHNITNRYKKVKKNNRHMGTARMRCPFFDEIDAILQAKPNIAACKEIGSSRPIMNQSSSSDSVYEGGSGGGTSSANALHYVTPNMATPHGSLPSKQRRLASKRKRDDESSSVRFEDIVLKLQEQFWAREEERQMREAEVRRREREDDREFLREENRRHEETLLKLLEILKHP